MKFNELYESSPSVVTIEQSIVSNDQMKKIFSKYPKGTEFVIDGFVSITKENLKSIDFKFKKTKHFDCSNNDLTSLENCPEETTDNFNCSHNDLRTLEGGPEIVRGGFICSVNEHLGSLAGGPSLVTGDYLVVECGLTTFKGIPIKFEKGNVTVTVRYNKIDSFDYCPSIINGNFNVSDNNIESLVGIHRSILSCRTLNLSNNPIKEGGIGLIFVKELFVMDVVMNLKML